MDRRKSKVKKSKNRLVMLVIIALILICAFMVKFFNSESGNVGIIDHLLGESFDTKVNAKEFGTPDLKKDDRGNFYIYLNTGMKTLDAAVDKVVADFRTNATTYETYSIDCTSKIIFNNIYEVKYLLLEDKNPKADIAKTMTIYYSKESDKIINSSDILRANYKSIAKYRFNDEIKFDDIDMNSFQIQDKQIVFGKEGKQVTLDYEKYKQMFKAGLGIPSLYTGEIYKPNIIPIDPSKKHIAFTFDDGPANVNHQKIRELFDKYGQQATFCFVGQMAQENPDMVLETYKKGHMIINHSWSHPDLVRLTPEQQAKEILDTEDILFKTTGYDVDVLRPPYGSFNQTTKDIVNDKIALWTVDSLDWKSRNTQSIINEVTPYIADGAVVLFHDLYEPTYHAIEQLLPQLLDQGYQFVRMDVLEDYMNNK